MWRDNKIVQHISSTVTITWQLKQQVQHEAGAAPSQPSSAISLIRPILEYCDTLWGCCGEGNSQALEALQKRAGRIVAKTSRSSPAMDILKWPALAERRREHVFQLVKKCIEGRCPQYFDGCFTFNSKIHSRATRQCDLLHLPAVRTEVAKRSYLLLWMRSF